MVVVMPALAMGEEAPAWQVRRLYGSAGHQPVAGARIVSKVGHDPMACDADRNPHEYTPNDPVDPAKSVKDGSECELV